MSRYSRIQGITLLLLAAIICAWPWIAVTVLAPSADRLLAERDVELGHITSAGGTDLEIHGVIGNVFAPKATQSDLGYDLVALSLFFDPLQVDSSLILPENPLLVSALYASSGDSTALMELVEGLLGAVLQSKDGVLCIVSPSPGRVCEGDQFVPYIWAVHRESPLAQNGVKNIAGVPLFDPTLYSASGTSDRVFRRRLRKNLRIVVRRLVAEASTKLGPSVHSLAFAALGSTSHTGGDSPAFLTFQEGFREILSALKSSHPNSALDRVYLVAYDRHIGVYRQEAVSSLVDVGRLLALQRLTQSTSAALIVTLLAFSGLLFSVLSYQNVGQIVRTANRWDLIGKLSGTSAALMLLPATCLMAGDSIFPSVTATLSLYTSLAASALLFILWLSKRLRRPEPSSWLRGLKR